jgi:hypothetical protein
VRVLLVVSLASVLAGTARAGNAPCQPGTGSGTGMEPCFPCDPGYVQPNAGGIGCIGCFQGTYQPNAGQTACLPCPSNSAATSPGSTQCASCGCDDEVACTRDTCQAATGACSSTPVPSCSVTTIALAGTIASFFPPTPPNGSDCVDVGEPLTISFDVDPEAPDTTGAHRTDQSSYTVTSVEFSMGAPGSEITASMPTATEELQGDQFGNTATVNALTGLGHVTPITCDAPYLVTLSASDPSTTLTGWTDAQILDAAGFLAYPIVEATVTYLDADSVGLWMIGADGIHDAPEPATSATALAAVGALAAFSRARALASPRRRA